MSEGGYSEEEVLGFLVDQIDTVPQLEALLLLWNSRPKPWSAAELAEWLFVRPEIARDTAEDLVRRGLAESAGELGYAFHSGTGVDEGLIAAVDQTYRRQIVRVSNLIHSKGSPAVRAFARAFRLRKQEG
jgi:hypothetical protein